MDKEQKVVPAGSIPIGQEPEPEKDETKEPELLLGKYKSTDELIKAHENLQAKLNDQGQELGSLRKDKEFLSAQLTQHQKAIEAERVAKEAASKTPPTNYEKEMSDIYRLVDEGELSVAEALQKSNALTARMVEEGTLGKATSEFQKILSQRDAETIQKDFLKQNPDFVELKQSGKLEAIKQGNPLHDDLSAYYALKAQMNYDKGKAEQAALEKGAEGTDTVIKTPGTAIRETKTQKPRTPAEQKASMMKALEKAGA